MGNANEAVRGRSEKPGRLGERARAAQEAAQEAAIDCAEHLSRDFARVRARFGMDHALAQRSLAAAWTTNVIQEEDEAEFVDTLADCVGAGLSLDSALTSWDIGTLAADDDDEDADDELAARPLVMVMPPPPRGGRRVYVR